MVVPRQGRRERSYLEGTGATEDAASGRAARPESLVTVSSKAPTRLLLVFTGIVRERGRVVAADRNGSGLRLRIRAQTAAEPGDSVAVAGTCLTVTTAGGGELAFDAVAETLERTTLGSLEPGDEVNLEPALRAG